MPRFSIGEPAAAAQIARSCESDKASMPPMVLLGRWMSTFLQSVRQTKAAGTGTIHSTITDNVVRAGLNYQFQ
jgi:hypothetical protein